MQKLGFIGMGNMAQALCAGFVSSGKISSDRIFAYAPDQKKLAANAGKFGFNPCSSLKAVVSECDTLIMACKPYQIESVLAEVKGELSGKALVSIAAGWNFARYSQILGSDVRIQFVMPNTPAMVKQGVMLFEKSNSLKEDERTQVMDLFSSVGLVEELADNLMGIGMSLTGCAPAFVDLFMEAYADAAVKYGMPRATAYKLVSQMVLGSAMLARETQEHPGVLKDKVCSPGGTTIRGVVQLEKDGFRGACINSIDAIMSNC